jgi:hypothetical protein
MKEAASWGGLTLSQDEQASEHDESCRAEHNRNQGLCRSLG